MSFPVQPGPVQPGAVPQTPAAPTHRDAITPVLDAGLHQLASGGGDLIDHANQLGEILWSPPRVVIVGRLKAGKSTLVNALIGAPVAETAALEATRVVTVYQDGAPSRAEVVGLDGSREPVDISQGQVASLPMEAQHIAYIHRWLPSAAIRDLTLIDTPGLATLTVENEAATRRVLIDGFEQTRSASVDADAAVFLFDATPRVDEIEFLNKLPFTPLNTLGVLSRADGFGEGSLGRRDPLEHATEHAGVLAHRLADTVSGVIPISGLMAQTSHTGQLTEHDASSLATLSNLSPLALVDVFEDDASSVIDPVVRDRLLDLVGEYGVINGRQIAQRGAAALNSWLIERSGIAQLQQTLLSSLSQFAILHRAQRILDRLDRLAFSHQARDHIRTVTYTIRANPAMRPVALIADLQRVLEADPRSPLVGELRQLLEAPTAQQKLGLAPHADGAQVSQAAMARLTEVQSKAAMGTQTAAEDAALATLVQTYTEMVYAG